MKTGLLCPSYILCHQSWKEDYKFPSYILCHENRTLKRSTVMFYALLRNVSHAKTEKTEFNNCLSVCHGMSVFACIDTCINTCIVSASLMQVFFLFSFFPKRFPMEFSQSNWDTLKQRYSIQSFLSCTLIPKQFPSRQQLLLLSATFFPDFQLQWGLKPVHVFIPLDYPTKMSVTFPWVENLHVTHHDTTQDFQFCISVTLKCLNFLHFPFCFLLHVPILDFLFEL